MRLKTQFIITLLLFGIILVVIAASAIIANRHVENVMGQERRAVDIARGAGELGYLFNDYLIYREGQQLKRWQQRFASFAEQAAGLRGGSHEQQILIANIKANQGRLKEVFDSIASAPENPARNRNAALDAASFQVSWSRMAVQNQVLEADASRLVQLMRHQRDELTYRRTMLIYVLVGLFGVFLIVSYMQTYRRILKSIVTLRDGTVVIGSGNLDFFIEETKNDEIGELSNAFNRMTADLKAVTASKDDLEIEITERERAEEQLRITLESIGDGFFACDKDWRFVYVNAPAERILGISREEVLGKNHWEVFPLTLGTNLEREYRRAAAGETIDFENFYEPWGRWFHNRCSPREGGGMSVYFEDITRRKRAEEKLRQSEEKYLKTFQSNPACVGLNRLSDGYIIEANEAMLKLLGYNRDEFIGHTIPELRVWNDPADREHLMQTLANEGKSENQEYWLRTKAGALLLCNHSAELIQMDNEPHAIFTFYDITERKRMEEEVKQRTSELEEANKELESFAYTVSHDLRAPLRAIDGFTRMLVRDAYDKLSDEEKRRFDVIRNNAQKMGRLIDDLLSFSRLGRQAISSSAIDMGDLVTQVWEECRVSDPGRRMELKIGDLPPAFADPGFVRQVLTNLISNAVKFTRHTVEAVIEVGAREEAGESVYFVKDNGAGFDMRYYDKLFGVFQRLHSGEEYEGTGVGLALVQRIIHRHGGRVWAEGKEGEGAAFFFSLPGDVRAK
jgi:PAS domain S-box-containing protein